MRRIVKRQVSAKLSRFFLYSGILLIFIYLISAFWTKATNRRLLYSHKPTTIFTEEVSFVRKLFKTEKPQKAYAYFLDTYKHFEPPFTYNLAHIVGMILYDTHGNEGIVFCDESYESGCFHGFFSKTVISLQTAPWEVCDSLPISKLSGCIHGIGHGLLVLYGYTIAGLEHALAVCKSSIEYMSGCSDGVFMEFNTNITSEVLHGSNSFKTSNSSSLYEPCESLSHSYQSFCYLDQAPRWYSYITQDFSLIVSFCSDISDINNRLSCYQGIGRITPDGKENADILSSVCKTILEKSGYETCLKEVLHQ